MDTPKTLFPMVITVRRDSNRFVANMSNLPDHAVIRLEGQKWTSSSRV